MKSNKEFIKDVEEAKKDPQFMKEIDIFIKESLKVKKLPSNFFK